MVKISPRSLIFDGFGVQIASKSAPNTLETKHISAKTKELGGNFTIFEINRDREIIIIQSLRSNFIIFLILPQEKILHYWCQATSGCSNFVDFWAIHLRFGHNDANHEFCWFFENCFVCRSHFWGFPFFIFSDFAETRMPLAQRFSAFQAFRVFSKLNEVSSVRSEFIGVKRKLFHEWKGQSKHFPLCTLRNLLQIFIWEA